MDNQQRTIIRDIVDAVYKINIKYHGKEVADEFLSEDIYCEDPHLTELEDIIQTQKANYPISNEVIQNFINNLNTQDYPVSDMVGGLPPEQAAELLLSICNIMLKNN